ncbi:MAG TPA: hypothetical protein VKI43_08010 [Vicinamibacterales bacterium]|nr:hypothetical protein [Vicinamibacterales bacterium]
MLARTPFIDVHTHLFPPGFGTFARSGIDDLLTYHYLEAELFRASPIRPEQYWSQTPAQRADLVWQTLFVEQTPLSEATRGVVSVLHRLGLNPAAPSLAPLREFFRDQHAADHAQRVFRLAGISTVVMTNDPLDADEMAEWDRAREADDRFQTALRLDRILNDWEEHHPLLTARGYDVSVDPDQATLSSVRRFLVAWAQRFKPRYMAVSLPDTFDFPRHDLRTTLLSGAVLPACRDLGLPLSLMIGVRRQVNPALRLAGDASGRADLRAVATLCAQFPDNRFMVSVLSRENQHELCVYARKFANLLPFGCWWFLNNPSIVAEIIAERLEMLGTSFIPQHSDARVLEQLLYKWDNTRRILAPILANTYKLLAASGRPITRDDIERDVTKLFRTNFERWRV